MRREQSEPTPLFPGAETWGLQTGAGTPDRADAVPTESSVASPSVATLLALDEEYRAGAAAGTLPRITPRRLNPQARPWLPILRTEREGWTLHVVYSNTWRAHQFGRTHDWVVIGYERDGAQGQATVVTESRGRLRGRRVVRGRELESLRAHEAATSPRRRAG